MIMRFLVFVGLCGISFSQAAEPPERIDLRSASVTHLTAHVIPIPLEVFAALDKLGKRDWNHWLECRDFQPGPDRSRSALLFGLAISQGFMAVQAQNPVEVRRVGRAVQNLAGPLGVGRAVEERLKVIIDELNAENWEGVRRELDRTRHTVLETMKMMRDEDLARLVSLGGWLGGTEAVSSMLMRTYDPESSDLLNQVGLLEQLREDFERLPASLREEAIFVRIDEGLRRLEQLMCVGNNGVVTHDKVVQIYREAQTLVEAIYEG